MKSLFGAFGLLLSLAGCQVPGAPASPNDVARPTTVAVQGQLQLGYRLQAVESAYAAAAINHVTLSLYKPVNGVDGVAVASKVIVGGALAGAVSLGNLQIATAYKVVARAYADSAGTIEIDNIAQSGSDAQCSTAFTTPAVVPHAAGDALDDAPRALALALRLADRAYTGHGTFSISVASGKVTQVQVSLFVSGNATAIRQATYPVATATSTTYALSNLKLGTGYSLQADGLTSNGRVHSTVSQAFSTPPLANGSVEDAVGALALAL